MTREDAALFVVGEKHSNAEIFHERPERCRTHVLDHLERRWIERDELVASATDFCREACGGARRIGEERPCTQEQVVAAVDDRLGKLLRQEKEVCTAARHHAALTGLIDEHCDAAGEMRVGLDEVVLDALVLEVFSGEIAESIAANFANETSIEPATTSPHGDIGAATTWSEHHFAERVAALQHLIVRADEYIPCEVANDAQTHAVTLPMADNAGTIAGVSVLSNTTLDDAFRLSEQSISDYRGKGHAVVRNLATQAEVDAYSPAIADATFRMRGDERPLAERDTYGKAFIQSMNLWTIDEQVRRFVFARRFARVAAELTGVTGVRLYHDQALFKEPGGGITPWHQDQVYWPLDTKNTITMWMPLVDVPTDVGSVVFVSGSHTSDDLGGAEIGDRSEQYFDELISRRGFESQSYAPMRAGDATFHSGWTLHGAPANETSTMRRVMTIIYYADGTRVGALDNPMRENDARQWLGSRRTGEVADGPLNPLLWSA